MIDANLSLYKQTFCFYIIWIQQRVCILPQGYLTCFYQISICIINFTSIQLPDMVISFLDKVYSKKKVRKVMGLL